MPRLSQLLLPSLLALLASACQPTATESPLVPETPSTPSTLPAHPRTPPPVTPIHMEKPRTLGPVSPPIVLLPAHLREPLIRIRLGPERDSPLPIKPNTYRGTLDTYRLANSKYITINKVPIENYLPGVLSKELYGSWEPETFRALAVAARTYALYQILTPTPNQLYDVTADESSQVYGGRSAETQKSRTAVAATRGQILLANVENQTGVFCAYFSACSGGSSQDPYEAWGDSVPAPLRARKLDPWELTAKCPRYYWDPVTVSKSEVSRLIRAWAQRNEIKYLLDLAPIKYVAVSRRDPATNRSIEFALTDAKGRTVPIRAEEFRLAFLQDPAHTAPALQSSNCDILDAGPNIQLVHGQGFGHGIGLSQWGAQGMALSGYNAYEILGYYYPGTTLRVAW